MAGDPEVTGGDVEIGAKEAALILGVSLTTVYELALCGDLPRSRNPSPTSRRRQRFLFWRSEVHALKERQRRRVQRPKTARGLRAP